MTPEDDNVQLDHRPTRGRRPPTLALAFIAAAVALTTGCSLASDVSATAVSQTPRARVAQASSALPTTTATRVTTPSPTPRPATHAPRPPARVTSTVTIQLPAPTPTVTTTVAPTPTTSYPPETPPWPGTSLATTLSSDYRWDVALVQRRLNRLGYGPLTVDGDYGPVTAGVVRQYQSDYGLIVDGVVGPQTWSSLFASCHACD